jgi:alpha-L-fucosidase
MGSSTTGVNRMTIPRSALLYVSLLPGLVLSAGSMAIAQDHSPQERETDPLVLKRLEWFQDMKFGLLMHWGPYSQWGVVESWSLCPEDEGWCQRRGPYAKDYWEYKKAYENLKSTFNPLRFDPDRWASAAKGAGMRYVVFTTKHHDGFCMFDTRTTDYRITDKDCPFSASPRRNVTREIFEAFRKQGFGIGAYFSKPDWHAPDYWWSYFPPLDRNVNYDITKHPERWESFKQFTFDQIKELMSEYGRVDILWLDGGWVNPGNRGQDIDLSAIAGMARSYQPGLIVVDRAVPGRFENYRTPEQEVPDKPLDYVWETCMTMATSWSYVPGDQYKPTRKLVHLLVDVVAKGGNFLLNIGPSPEGELPPAALERLKEIGDWMKVNGGAIYATRPLVPYAEGRVRFTQSADGQVNAVYLADPQETGPPAVVTVSSNPPRRGSSVTMLGFREPLKWEPAGKGFAIHIAEAVRNNPPCNHAWTFQYRTR